MNIKKLVAETDNKPRFHGNGFTQLYLSDDTRLHVWHPALPPLRDDSAMVHDHRFDLSSEILLGKIEHVTFNSLPESNNPSHNVIVIEGASKSGESNFKNIGTTELAPRHRYIFAKGSSYDFRGGLFHTSSPVNDIAVTLMTKTNNPFVEWARMATVIGTDSPTHAFTPATQPSQADLWLAINEAIHLID